MYTGLCLCSGCAVAFTALTEHLYLFSIGRSQYSYFKEGKPDLMTPARIGVEKGESMDEFL